VTDHIKIRLIATDQKDTRAGSTAARLYQGLVLSG